MQENYNHKMIAKLEKQKLKPKNNYYLAYIVLIITLIYMVDEIASQIGMLMKTEIANDLFARFGNSSVGALDLLGILVVPFQFIGLLYRPLADKWGRKIFLVINTFGMSIALLFIYLSQSVWLYFIGAAAIQFFIPHDMHVVYIMESVPHKHRAKIYSSIKFIATLAVMLIPLLRKVLMDNASQWRNVFLIPAIIGLIASFIALLFAKETDSFIDAKIRYLKEKEVNKGGQGGLFQALKFAFKHKQLRFLYMTTAFVNLGFIGTINYQVIMSYGFAEGIYGSFSDEVMNLVSVGPVTAALLLFPIGCALSQFFMGFISDKKGRKVSAIVMAMLSLISFLAFYFGARLNFNAYFVGILCGFFIGSYYALNDVLIMMVGESSPTNLRSSTMSAQFIVTAIGVVISYLVSMPVITLLGNQSMGIIAFVLLVPGYIIALIIMSKFTHDTKHINLDTVTGFEWD